MSADYQWTDKWHGESKVHVFLSDVIDHKLLFGMIRNWNPESSVRKCYMKIQVFLNKMLHHYASANGHTTFNIPILIWSPQLSNIGHG